MSDHRESPRAPEFRRVSAGRAAIAAIAPLICVLGACGVGTFAVRGDLSDLAQRFREAGVGGLGIAGVTLVALPVLSILLFFSARGVRIPVALPLGVALVPWIAGAAASALGLAQAMEALAYADASTRASLFAAGFAESLSGRLFGGFFSLALLIGLAFGLALAAMVLEAPGRRGALAGVGALVTLPLLVVAVIVGGGFGTLATAAGAVAVGAMASSAIGADAHGRSGALATGALVAAGLAVLMALGCAQNIEVTALFGALGYAAPSDRAQMLAIGLGELSAPWASWAVLGAGALGALTHAGLAAWRSPPSFGRMAGALVVVGLALAVGLAESRPAQPAGPMPRQPGVQLAQVPWVTLLPLGQGNASHEPPAAVVSPDGLLDLDGERIVAWSEPLASVLRDLHDRAAGERRERESQFYDGLEAPAEDPEARTLALAFDAQLEGAKLKALFEAAAEAGLSTILVIGVDPDFDPERHAAVARAMPIFSAMLSPLRSALVDLSTYGPYREESIARYVDVGASLEVREAPARGDRGATQGGRFALRTPPSATYLFLDDATPASGLGRAIDAVTVAGGTPVVVVPRDESRRRQELEPPPEPTDGDPAVRGSLSREVIQGVIRGHVNEVRSCYERELARDPTLTGRMVVRMIISPTGSVQTASIQSSTFAHPTIDACITRAVNGWSFPPPVGGGIVIVNYPFVFNPG